MNANCLLVTVTFVPEAKSMKKLSGEYQYQPCLWSGTESLQAGISVSLYPLISYILPLS